MNISHVNTVYKKNKLLLFIKDALKWIKSDSKDINNVAKDYKLK